MTEFLHHILIPPGWRYTIAALVQCVLLLVVALCSAAVFIWLERKVSARIQDRLGPTRVGGRFGWLQPPADGIKLLCKEDIIPAAADAAAVPPGPVHQFLRRRSACSWRCRSPTAGWRCSSNVGVFFILAVAGLEVFGVILGGYASGSKWSLYGAMREAAQVVSYEIPLGLCVVVPVMIAGTMDLVDDRQRAGRLVLQLVHVPRSVHVRHVLGLRHLRRGQHEPGPVRSARGRKRTGGRLPDRILRLPLGDFLHGRIRGRCSPSAGWRRSCSSAAGTGRCPIADVARA